MLEICVEDLHGITAAVMGGADRLELCAALDQGGLTPSAALIRHAAAAAIPTHVLIRPRGGDFVYGPDEAALILEEIDCAAEARIAGLVIGASLVDHRLDVATLSRFVDRARDAGHRRGTPLSLTLHRAFDLCPSLSEAMESAVALGFDRILTSGGAGRAIEGIAAITALRRQANGRIRLLAGAGIDASMVTTLLAAGADEIHASARAPRAVDSRLVALGFSPPTPRSTDPGHVSNLARAIQIALQEKIA